MATYNAAFEASPAGADNPKYGDDKIREFKTELRLRLDHEHVCKDSTPTTGGVHREGSAKVFYQSTEPTNKPDSTDGVLDADDDGRIWVDSDTTEMKVFDGSTLAFVRVNKGVQLLTADPATPLQGEEWLRTDLV